MRVNHFQLRYRKNILFFGKVNLPNLAKIGEKWERYRRPKPNNELRLKY